MTRSNNSKSNISRFSHVISPVRGIMIARQSRRAKRRNVEMHARRRLMAKFTENYPMVPGTTRRARHSRAVKGAKGRRSVLNVTQPRRKAKLQLVQSTVPSSAPYRHPFRDALLSATWYREDANELRVRGGRRAGEGEVFRSHAAKSEFPSPFSGAKFNCTCSCSGEKRESIIERCRDLCAHTEYEAFYSHVVSWS